MTKELKKKPGQGLGEKCQIDIRRLASDGSGVGLLDGMTTFVRGLLPREQGRVVVTEQKKKYRRADLVEITRTSEERRVPPCPVYSECGGCTLQHMDYAYTLCWKRIWVEDALKRIGKIEIKVNPVLGMEDPWHYRNKAVLHRDQAGRIGYYREKTNDVVEFPYCLLLPERMNKRIHIFKEILKENLTKNSSRIKSLTFRENSRGKGLLLLEGDIPAYTVKKFNKLIGELTKEHELSPENFSLVIHNNQGRTIQGSGVPYLVEYLDNLRFRVSPGAFLQVNPQQTEKLYSILLEWAELKGNEEVWDLYCGIGTITLMLAKRAVRVIGIEENPSAVRDAVHNARENNILNVSFVQGRVERKIGELRDTPDLVVVDPPRAGLNKHVVDRLLELKPPKIIYVSCDPATMARDAGMLVNGNGKQEGAYTLEKVRPVDMFPWTGHVECVVSLKRKHSR